MKKLLLPIGLVMALTATGVEAHMMEGPGTTPGYDNATPQQQYPYGMYPGMMGGYGGYGMGPGMMGGGYGGYGMGPGMMGGYGGYGMGPGMMGGYGGYGMGPGMMGGYGYDQGGEQGYPDPEKYKKFMAETKDLRKKLHDMQFEYGEMLRNPNTTIKDKINMEKEMFELQQKIREKAAE